MASGSSEVYDTLKTILFMDSAVAGEAAGRCYLLKIVCDDITGLAMGLVMLGVTSEAAQVAIEEMIVYAHETQHEKIIRGLALGVALVMYGKEEGADTL